MIFVASCSSVQNSAEAYCDITKESYAKHAEALVEVKNEEAIYTGVLVIRQRDAFCNGHFLETGD